MRGRKPERVIDVNALTNRERMVLELLAAGLSNRQIGKELGIRETTARTYVDHIMEKMYLPNRTTLAAAAILYGMVSLERIRDLMHRYHPYLAESVPPGYIILMEACN